MGVEENVHGELVELSLIELLLLHGELDLEVFTKGPSVWTSEGEVCDVNFAFLRCWSILSDLHWNDKSLWCFWINCEINWDCDVFEQIENFGIEFAHENTTWFVCPVSVVNELDLCEDEFSWVSSENFLWKRDNLASLVLPDLLAWPVATLVLTFSLTLLATILPLLSAVLPLLSPVLATFF